MIKVTIELISAITHRTSTLGTMYIANDGNGTAERGDYKVAVCRKGSAEPPRELLANSVNKRAARTGEIKAYPRLAYNVWRLIARATLAAFPEERNPAKTTTLPVLDASVMRGLAKFAHDKLVALGPQPGKAVEEVLTPNEVAAFEWLAAGTADKDD
jgi:hypothetical protein